MSTSRTWVILSGLVGAIFLMFRSLLNSVTGARSFLPTLPPIFILHVIIFVLAASASFFGNGSDDSPATNHHHDDHDTSHHHEHDHDRSSSNSSNSSFDQHNNKVQEEAKLPVTSKSGGSFGISSPDVSIPSTPLEKPVGIRRPPIAPLKTFRQVSSASTSGDENVTMEEMWERVKAEKQPKKPKTTMSSSSWPSPSRGRGPLSSPGQSTPGMWGPPSSPGRSTPGRSSPGQSKKKLMERMPSWVKLKKELSMGREELNSKVEAFITKFKDEMKLQRLESVKRYKAFTSRTDDYK